MWLRLGRVCLFFFFRFFFSSRVLSRQLTKVRTPKKIQYMREAQHIGKVVVTQPMLLCREATYLITGGLGYVGQLVAKGLIEHGARSVVLLSSSRCELPSDWEGAVRPAVVKCDVGDLSQVQAVLQTYANTRGIVHAAGVLADQTLSELSVEAFEPVYRPKVHGARNLHECTAGMELDFFVLCSSIASGFGSAGQANYAAANGCLDALALERQQQGLPAVSVR